jgi:hypothetical protein
VLTTDTTPHIVIEPDLGPLTCTLGPCACELYNAHTSILSCPTRSVSVRACLLRRFRGAKVPGAPATARGFVGRRRLER